MKKHEVEALRGLATQLKARYEEDSPYDDLSYAAGLVDAAKSLEKLLDSLPAPDDGLREGLAAIVAGIDEACSMFEEKEGQDSSALKVANICREQIKELLAKTPDGWKPIADAPRDGRTIIVGHIESVVCKARSWDEEQGWIDEDGNQGLQDFTHWRPMPAPPREGKECES